MEISQTKKSTNEFYCKLSFSFFSDICETRNKALPNGPAINNDDIQCAAFSRDSPDSKRDSGVIGDGSDEETNKEMASSCSLNDSFITD